MKYVRKVKENCKPFSVSDVCFCSSNNQLVCNSELSVTSKWKSGLFKLEWQMITWKLCSSKTFQDDFAAPCCYGFQFWLAGKNYKPTSVKYIEKKAIETWFFLCAVRLLQLSSPPDTNVATKYLDEIWEVLLNGVLLNMKWKHSRCLKSWSSFQYCSLEN